ncbi:MAG: hypothetical protein EOO41_01660 [Methanobacteriota archaeon]|nr:MAG: hypothetical protein EOO41_01660 [Euryarchaeota archaeon]
MHAHAPPRPRCIRHSLYARACALFVPPYASTTPAPPAPRVSFTAVRARAGHCVCGCRQEQDGAYWVRWRRSDASHCAAARPQRHSTAASLLHCFHSPPSRSLARAPRLPCCCASHSHSMLTLRMHGLLCFILQGSEMPEVKALAVLQGDGTRIAVKYFTREFSAGSSIAVEFEKKAARKARASGDRGEVEVMLQDGYTIAYRSLGDVLFLVVGGTDENELILAAVVDALAAAVAAVIRGTVDKRAVHDNLELLLLCMDELVDGGVILELDPAAIESRVMLRGAVPDALSSYKELTMTAVVDKLRDRASRQFARA